MDMSVFGLEPGTSERILILGAATMLILALITVVARRRHSYWWVSISFIIAGCAGLALGSYFAVRIFVETIQSMSKTGGGISAVYLGIWQATRPGWPWSSLWPQLYSCFRVRGKSSLRSRARAGHAPRSLHRRRPLRSS
jgi:hypothetical protein